MATPFYFLIIISVKNITINPFVVRIRNRMVIVLFKRITGSRVVRLVLFFFFRDIYSVRSGKLLSKSKNVWNYERIALYKREIVHR